MDTTNGQTSFVSAREDAWHMLGTVLDHTFTAQEAMEVGHLGGWNVRKTPAFTVVDGQSIPMPGRYATVRNNPITGGINYLGDVGESYTPIQNEEHADLLNTLIDESGAHLETAGALGGGKQVFVTMKLPGFIKVGGVDPIENYIAAVNSHDGGSSFAFMVTPVRVVCKNTLDMAFNSASHIFRVRHTSGAQKILVQQARETLDMTFAYLEGLQVEADRMIDKSLTQTRFEEIISEAFGAPKDAHSATVTRTDNKLDEMARLFGDASTQDGIRNTVWAGLNAITEWADHFAPTRGEDRDASRAIKSLFDPSFKNQALRLMMAELNN